MIEMYHPVHACVHPCAAEESELPRLLREGWVRTKEELATVRPQPTIIDEFDERVNAMLAAEDAADATRQSRHRGCMPLNSVQVVRGTLIQRNSVFNR